MDLITEHLDVWTAAQVHKAAGRGKRTNNQRIYGVKKLRELILELAVRGKLVPQNSDDKPATTLLQEVANKRGRLLEAGKIKKQKTLPEILEEEKPFELPGSWEWERLGKIAQIIRGITFPASEKLEKPEPGRVACLRTSNVQEQIEWGDLLYIREQVVKRADQIIE